MVKSILCHFCWLDSVPYTHHITFMINSHEIQAISNIMCMYIYICNYICIYFPWGSKLLFAAACIYICIICIYIYICILICIYVYMYICIYVYMYICIYVYVYMYICIYVYMYICIYVYMYICIYVSMYLCIYVSMYLCICIYIILQPPNLDGKPLLLMIDWWWI